MLLVIGVKTKELPISGPKKKFKLNNELRTVIPLPHENRNINRKHEAEKKSKKKNQHIIWSKYQGRNQHNLKKLWVRNPINGLTNAARQGSVTLPSFSCTISEPKPHPKMKLQNQIQRTDANSWQKKKKKKLTGVAKGEEPNPMVLLCVVELGELRAKIKKIMRAEWAQSKGGKWV